MMFPVCHLWIPKCHSLAPAKSQLSPDTTRLSSHIPIDGAKIQVNFFYFTILGKVTHNSEQDHP